MDRSPAQSSHKISPKIRNTLSLEAAGDPSLACSTYSRLVRATRLHFVQCPLCRSDFVSSQAQQLLKQCNRLLQLVEDGCGRLKQTLCRLARLHTNNGQTSMPSLLLTSKPLIAHSSVKSYSCPLEQHCVVASWCPAL